LARSKKDDNKSVLLQNSKKQKEFVDAFGINDTGSNKDDSDEDRDLNSAEQALLDEFEKNDNELEELAGQIVGALDVVKGTAENIEAAADQ